MDLSVIIPSRNEKYLQKTIEDVLSHIKGNTEILVGIDGNEVGIDMWDSDKIQWFVKDKPIGQRALQNYLAKQAKGKYIMKLDAHCSLSDGFDIEMMKYMDDKTVMTPIFCALDADNWQVLPTPRHAFGRFGKDFVFKFWPEYEERDITGDITETLALHGSCFMVDREMYFNWNLCDESWGSWGRQATEVSIKTWLNSGRVVSNWNAYYGHMFRGEKDFPYKRNIKEIKATEKKCQALAKHKNFQKVLDRFSPLPEWH